MGYRRWVGLRSSCRRVWRAYPYPHAHEPQEHGGRAALPESYHGCHDGDHDALGRMGPPSGVLLYYDTSALWQVVQQKLVTQRVMDRAKAEAQAKLDKQPVEVEVVRKEHKPRPKKKAKA